MGQNGMEIAKKSISLMLGLIIRMFVLPDRVLAHARCG
jgi:hypothetical protein